MLFLLDFGSLITEFFSMPLFRSGKNLFASGCNRSINQPAGKCAEKKRLFCYCLVIGLNTLVEIMSLLGVLKQGTKALFKKKKIFSGSVKIQL